MRKLAISAFALAAMASGAMAGEPVTLTDSQLDNVAAGFTFQSNRNRTTQVALASASAHGGCIVAVCAGGYNGNASAYADAYNSNSTHQINID
jgi:hypothetical protein